MHLILFILISILFWSCSSTPETPTAFWKEFCCRDEGNPSERLLIYRAKVPLNWQEKSPDPQQSLQDTTKPNVEFFIPTFSASQLYLTLHTFPVETFTQRIPSEAQITRWKQQFDQLDFTSIVIKPRSRAGFTGFSFYAEGLLKGRQQAIYSFSMLLDPLHWFILQPNKMVSFKSRQMASGYTIKVIGPSRELLEKQKEIDLFANSFELIEEIPSP